MSQATFEFPIRVYYEDTDAAGVVYYANYLKFFERARTEWLRSVGISQQRLVENEGLLFVVRRTTVEYHAPARLDDTLSIVSRLAKLGRVSVEFSQEAWRGAAGNGELLATGHIKVACAKARDVTIHANRPDNGPVEFRPAAIPESIRESIRNSFRPLCP